MNAAKFSSSLDLNSVYIDPTDSPIDYHRDALSYWENKRGARFAPAWSEVSLMDFAPRAIPLISVVDINADTFELSFRFWGTKLTELLGHDYTGQDLRDLQPKVFADGTIDAYRVMIEKKEPQLEIKEFFRGVALRGRQMVLRLPLSDDGQSVTKSINLAYQELDGASWRESDFFEHVLASG